MNKGKIINSVCALMEILKTKPKKILLSSNLYDWLLCSNWDCILSDELKFYIQNGGIVERIEKSDK